MHILMLLNGNIVTDARVCKEMGTLTAAGHDITLLELPPDRRLGSWPNVPGKLVSIRLLSRRLPKNMVFWPIKFMEMTARFFLLGVRKRPDVVHCHDFITLLSGYLIAKYLRRPFIYDSHEIQSERGAPGPRRMSLWAEQKMADKAERIIVTDRYRLKIISDILKLDPSRMMVLMNVPKINQDMTSKESIRSRMDVHKLFVYTGYLLRGRHIEMLIEAMSLLPKNYGLAIIGDGAADYKATLRELAIQNNVERRVVFVDPVPWSQLISFINSADCAFLFYDKSRSLNNYYCSPNKLFEALAAGLPVIASDNPLIKDVVMAHSCGICLREITPQTIANAVRQLLTKLNREEKSRLRQIAEQLYCWESQENVLITFYDKIASLKYF